MTGHGKIVCSCGAVIAQCRCCGESGSVRNTIPSGCEKCQAAVRALTSDEHLARLMSIQSGHAAFKGILEELPASRERSLALTKLEEAVMWASAGVMRGS